MDNENDVFKTQEIQNDTMYKRLNEYEPIDFLKALVDNYKNRGKEEL